MKELEVVIKAAKDSGRLLMEYHKNKFVVEKKLDKSPVTIADKKSENMIVSIIRKNFPEHNILAEEHHYPKTDSEYEWIIDPLDGTRNFIRKIPFFGNCIALKKNKRIIVSAINMPAMNLFAYAVYRKGAFINGKRIRVSRVNQLKDSFVSFGNLDILQKSYDKQFSHLLSTCYSHRGFGDILNYLLLAQGYIDIVLDFVYPWDVAAPKLIVEEAGGKVTNFNGEDDIYSKTCLATNGKLHNEVVNIFKKLK